MKPSMLTRFSVRGGTHDELVAAATAVWRQVTGQPDASLPDRTIFDVAPETEEFVFSNPEPVVRTWQADVVVNERRWR